VCSDQEAVDLIRAIGDPVAASKALVDHALARFSTDNLSCMVVRIDKAALLDSYGGAAQVGVEGDKASGAGVSEVERLVGEAKRRSDQAGGVLGVSGSNSGLGHDPAPGPELASSAAKDEPERMASVVEEEAAAVAEEGDATAERAAAAAEAGIVGVPVEAKREAVASTL
jgi:protein phosphatase PTC1